VLAPVVVDFHPARWAAHVTAVLLYAWVTSTIVSWPFAVVTSRPFPFSQTIEARPCRANIFDDVDIRVSTVKPRLNSVSVKSVLSALARLML